MRLFLALSYSRKQLQSLHLLLWIRSMILSTSFDGEVAINFILSINFILQDIVSTLSLPSLSIFITSFFIGTENFLNFLLFFTFLFFTYFFKLICQLFDYKMIILFPVAMENFRYLFGPMKYSCIMAVVPNFSMIYIFKEFFYEVFPVNITYFCIFMWF